MDKLLTAVVYSTHNQSLKQKLVGQLLQKYQEHSTNEIHITVFELTFQLFFGLTVDEAMLGEQILKEVAVVAPVEFLKYFCITRLVEALNNPTLNPASCLRMLRIVLLLKQSAHYKDIRGDCRTLLEPMKRRVLLEGAEDTTQMEVARLFLEIPYVLPPFDILNVCMRWLSSIQVDTSPLIYDKHTSLLMGLIVQLWEDNEEKILTTLILFFSLGSSRENMPSFALSAVLENIPPRFMSRACEFITSNSGVDDSMMELLLVRMSNWPMTPRLASWFINLLNGLIKANKFSVVIRIIANTAHIVIRQMRVMELRTGSVEVVSWMLLGYQHSPGVFHSLVPNIKSVFETDRSESQSIYSSSITIEGKEKREGEDIKERKGENTCNGEKRQKKSRVVSVKEINIQEGREKVQEKEKEKEKEKGSEMVDENGVCTGMIKYVPYSILQVLFRVLFQEDKVQIEVEDEEEEEKEEEEGEEEEEGRKYIHTVETQEEEIHKEEKKEKEKEKGKNKEDEEDNDDDEKEEDKEDKEDNKEKRGQASDLSLKRLANVVYALATVQYTGYPELYASLLPILLHKGYERPPTPQLQRMLANSNWSSSSSSSPSSSREMGVFVSDGGGRSGIGVAGLVNLRNTCYLNSFLQLLFMTTSFRNEVLSQHSIDKRIHPVTYQLQRVFVYLIQTMRHAFAPREFLRSMPPRYRSGHQQDSSEFAKSLLDIVEGELNGIKREGEEKEEKKRSELVQKTFGGMLEMHITCTVCNSIRVVKEPFTDMALSFAGEGGGGGGRRDSRGKIVYLEELINNFIDLERLEGDNMYYCSTCAASTVALKQYHVLQAPSHLVLTLSRFSYDMDAQRRTKLMTNVSYAEKLTLPVLQHKERKGEGEGEEEEEGGTCSTILERMDREEVIEENKESMESIGEEYMLYGVIMHSGSSAHHGHYYAYARGPRRGSGVNVDEDGDEDRDMWYQLNDSVVARSSFRSFSTITESFPTDVPYMLFYKKTHNIPPSSPSITPVLPNAIQNEVMADNNKFMMEVEEMEQANRRREKRKYLYLQTGGPLSYYKYDDEDDDDDEAGYNKGRQYDKDREWGGRGGFGGGMPRLVS